MGPRSEEVCAEIRLGDPARPGLGGGAEPTLSGTRCLSFRDMFPFVVKKARETLSKEEHAKVLAMEIYALPMTADGGLVKHVFE